MTVYNKLAYVVDDDAAVRSALKLLLETVGIQAIVFSEPSGFLNELPKLLPGCIILDIRMPVQSGLKLQQELIKKSCRWPVVVISGHGDIAACRQAFKNGAIDFLSKPVDEQDLIDVIQRGHSLLIDNERVTAQHAESIQLLESLTAREREVLDLVCGGFSSREIAESLKLSPRTVESYRAKIIAKFGTASLAELTRILLEASSAP